MKKFKFCMVAGSTCLYVGVHRCERTFLQIYKLLLKSCIRKQRMSSGNKWQDATWQNSLLMVRETDVWFNEQAEWVMTETDVESLEKVPAPVAEAFMESSTMTAMRLRDIRISHLSQTSYGNNN